MTVISGINSKQFCYRCLNTHYKNALFGYSKGRPTYSKLEPHSNRVSLRAAQKTSNSILVSDKTIKLRKITSKNTKKVILYNSQIQLSKNLLLSVLFPKLTFLAVKYLLIAVQKYLS